MKFCIVSCVFPPEPVVSSRTSEQIALALCARGHRVSIVTSFPHRPGGRIYPGYESRFYVKESSLNSYWVARLPSYFSPDSKMFGRFLENISFGISSGLAVLFSKRPDAIYANTWPLFAQGMVWLVCRLRRIPLVLSVQDIYPESLLIQDRLHHHRSLIFRILREMDRFVAQHSHAIILISEKFRQFYIRERGLAADKAITVPNWVDEIQEINASTDNDIRRHHRIPANAFLAVYGGNIGIASGIDKVIRAFEPLAEFENIYLLIAGDGPLLGQCRSIAQNQGNRRIIFHHPWRTDETSNLLGAADLLLLPTQGEQSLVSVPSKLISYMLSARPILALAHLESELAEVVLHSGCGWVIPPGDVHGFSNRIIEISALSKVILGKHGRAGRSFARRHYSMATNLPKIIDILERAGGKVERNPLHAID